MAKSNAVWGIDIGQCALKALKCRPHEKNPLQVVVESFDYIEYPKILSQPETDPAELVREALQQFLQRNEVQNDHVAISVAGQSGLARFIKLPPVESKKIPDIVKYEAKQQIPFALEDVVWDYQQLTGGSEEDGFALEPEVGLFAMKRDQVARALQPLEEAGIEVDLIQLTPLTIYNYICFDRLDDLSSQAYDPEDPPASTIAISLGTDTTDLVVTNGYRVWQRNIPIGGNHFTRALSKELRLTFAKAEHLKRNATQADDPKAVFQAMRPVFSDLLAEIQRSLGYFMSLDKSAKIGDVIALGKAMKLPGLQRYLSQNLDQDVQPIEKFQRLSQGSATADGQFKDNILSFAVAYGLCVQGLGKSQIQTNLLPEEIVRTRMIRAKKPWAIAGITALFIGLTFNYFTHVSAWSDTQTPAMDDAIKQAKTAQTTASTYAAERTDRMAVFTNIEEIGKNLVSNVEGRLLWMELLKGLDAAMPKDTRPAEERKDTKEDISERLELHITAFESKHYADLAADRYAQIEEAYEKSREEGASRGGEASGEGGSESDDLGEEEMADPMGETGDFEGDSLDGGNGANALEGPGWVIQLTGYHYHNLDQTNQTIRYVNNTLIKNLEEGTVMLPDGSEGQMMDVPLADLGISHAWVVEGKPLTDEVIDPNAPLNSTGRSGGYGARGYGGGGYGDSREGRMAAAGQEDGNEKLPPIHLKRYDFVVEFFWQPHTRGERLELASLRNARQEEAAAEAAALGEETAREDAGGGELTVDAEN
jgi:type IV pilus assembly protein PilM